MFHQISYSTNYLFKKIVVTEINCSKAELPESAAIVESTSTSLVLNCSNGKNVEITCHSGKWHPSTSEICSTPS